MFTGSQPDALKTNTSLVAAAFERLTHMAERLLRDVTNGEGGSPHFENVRELLASVPLNTEEHAIASQRLANAWRYAGEGEHGAARYELAMLVRNFAKRRQLYE